MLRNREIGQFLLLALLVFFLFHSEIVSIFIKKQLETELSKKLQSNVKIEKFNFTWPTQLALGEVSIEREAGGKIDIRKIIVNTSLISILSGHINTVEIELWGLRAMGREISHSSLLTDYDAIHNHWNYTLKATENSLKQIASSGSFSTHFDSPFLEISTCRMNDENIDIALQNPVRAEFDHDVFVMTPARFMAGPAIFDLEFAGNSLAFNAGLTLRIPSFEPFSSLMQNISLTGECVALVQFGGNWGAPILQGTASIRHASFEHWKHGTIFHNITANFGIVKDRIELKKLTAEDLSGGTLTGEGHLILDKDGHFPYELNWQFQSATVANLDNMQCHITGGLLFKGDRHGAAMSGELELEELDFYLKEGKSSDTHHFEVTYINQAMEQSPIAQNTHPTINWPIQLNLHLKNKGTISITDKQLNSKWKGDVNISGTSENMTVQGDCRLSGGDYLFNGRKFKLTQGTITFSGDPKKKTQLYVVGQQEVESIMVEVILKGPLHDLSLAFRSTPQLSEKEILCHLLFGRGTSEITPFQGAELTESINKLKNQGGEEPNFLSNLKKHMGIDRIDLSHGTGAESEEISLQVGKYLSPGVFIGLKKGITTDANRIGIEAELKKNIKLQAEIGDNSEGHLHLKWKHDY